MNSRSASSAPAACASASPTPTAPGGLVVRAHSAADPPVASTVPARGDRQRAVRRASRSRPRSGRPAPAAPWRWCPPARDALVPGSQRGQLAGDPPAGGGPAGVHDPPLPSGRPPGRARAPRGGRRRSARPALQVADAVGRVPAQHVHGAGAGGAATGGDGVLGVALGAVVHRQRGGDAALGPVARRARQGRARDQRHRAPSRPPPARRTVPRRPRPPRSCRRTVVWGRRGAIGSRGYRRAIAAPLYLRHPACFDHDTGAAPRTPRSHPRDRGADGQPRLAGLGCARGAACDRGATAGGTSRGVRASRARALPGGPRPATRHPRQPRVVGGRACARQGPPAPWPTRCWPAPPPPASAGCGRRATTPRPTGRWASACSPTPPWPPARARPRRRRAGASSSTGTCTTATARTRSSTPAPRCCSPACTSGRSTPARARWRHGLGRRAGVHDQPAGAGRVGRGRVAWAVEHVVMPAARDFAPGPDPGLGRASTHTATIRWRDCMLETRQLPPAGPPGAARWRPSWGCRSARCWRAATTWTRWRPRRWPRWRCSRTAASRGRCGRARWWRRRASGSGASGLRRQRLTSCVNAPLVLARPAARWRASARSRVL